MALPRSLRFAFLIILAFQNITAVKSNSALFYIKVETLPDQKDVGGIYKYAAVPAYINGGGDDDVNDKGEAGTRLQINQNQFHFIKIGSYRWDATDTNPTGENVKREFIKEEEDGEGHNIFYLTKREEERNIFSKQKILYVGAGNNNFNNNEGYGFAPAVQAEGPIVAFEGLNFQSYKKGSINEVPIPLVLQKNQPMHWRITDDPYDIFYACVDGASRFQEYKKRDWTLFFSVNPKNLNLDPAINTETDMEPRCVKVRLWLVNYRTGKEINSEEKIAAEALKEGYNPGTANKLNKKLQDVIAKRKEILKAEEVEVKEEFTLDNDKIDENEKHARKVYSNQFSQQSYRERKKGYTQTYIEKLKRRIGVEAFNKNNNEKQRKAMENLKARIGVEAYNKKKRETNYALLEQKKSVLSEEEFREYLEKKRAVARKGVSKRIGREGLTRMIGDNDEYWHEDELTEEGYKRYISAQNKVNYSERKKESQEKLERDELLPLRRAWTGEENDFIKVNDIVRKALTANGLKSTQAEKRPIFRVIRTEESLPKENVEKKVKKMAIYKKADDDGEDVMRE